ncbi:hypothetical protein EW026_g4489 [Hermanssonia centrifuga]|uniref:Fungal-type protein kinase domain-containing protein n=1 Tax=Hermanssonia centrifuga TaxID=98765 RepID=A0A4S4KLH0_9APHY|nr:hypothetical protein EW026_g4489 [Hermanssonia centrifuga]
MSTEDPSAKTSSEEGEGTPRIPNLTGFDHKAIDQHRETANAHMDSNGHLETPDFSNRFFPEARIRWLTPSQLKASAGEDPFAELRCDTETQMYTPLCKAFNKVLANTGHVIKDTGSHPESGVDDLKPDISMYKRGDRNGESVYTLKPKELGIVRDKERKERAQFMGRVAWGWMIMLIEVKKGKESEPFNFDEVDELTLREGEGARSRAQMIECIAQIQARQHRQCVFSALIVGEDARLMRWDARRHRIETIQLQEISQ